MMGASYPAPAAMTPPSSETASSVDISFVVIGYNEAASLGRCLRSVRDADVSGLTHELIYVDAGSQDDSITVARESGVDRVLGGETRRRAAENRNLGLNVARGRYIQFIDGDMVLAPDWPKAALELLEARDDTAAVCGNLNEANKSAIFRALAIDWAPREGYIRHCGGAAMYRREVLERMGGFPEDVAYGEEPFLCWRIRNEMGLKIYQLNRTMADHDLGFRGMGDYWRRNVRCGATYAEIAHKCRGTKDPLWLKEAVSNLAWAFALVAGLLAFIATSTTTRLVLLLIAAAVVARKTVQMRRRGTPWNVSLLYGFHVYFSKLAIAWGEVTWFWRRMRQASRGTKQ